MSRQILTSIIVVTYHTGRILGQVIDSVLSQTADVELILVNNGNPPEVERELVERFKDEPLVRLLTGHGNIGFSKAANLGARMASGEHLLFLSPTCVLPPDAVARFYDQEKLVKGPYLMGPRIVDRRGDEVHASRYIPADPKTYVIEALHLQRYFRQLRLELHKEPVPRAMTRVPGISRLCLFVKKSDFMALRGFNEGLFGGWEDYDLCCRFKQRGGYILFVPDVVVVHQKEGIEPFDPDLEKHRSRGLVKYFHENHTDKTFQPLLWGLYVLIWARYVLKTLLHGSLPFLKR